MNHTTKGRAGWKECKAATKCQGANGSRRDHFICTEGESVQS